MSFYMHPTRMAEYRAAQFIPTTAQRYCGGCKKRRSAAQFDGAAEKCKQCRLRNL